MQPFLTSNLLLASICTPFLGVRTLSFIPSNRVMQLRTLGLFFSRLTLRITVYIYLLFDHTNLKFQWIEDFTWISSDIIHFSIGVDGVSLLFIILTAFLMPICLLTYWKQESVFDKEYVIAFLLLEGFLICVFSVLNVFLFYIFFESVLLPMFIIIGVWGSRRRKVYAAYQLVRYTLIGSVFFLLGLFRLFSHVGTLDYLTLLGSQYSEDRQAIVWLCFFIGFAVKVPIVPFHIWLPEAHVEAPTAGSVILAGILLKLGTYGFYRYSLTLFPWATVYFIPRIYALSLVAIVYTAITTLRQVDLKKIIAYSSVAHIGFVILGLFSLNSESIEGSIFLMISHGLVSSALFRCIGLLYDRYKTRVYKYYSSLVTTIPLFSVFFFIFSLGNLAFPGTTSFVGEFMVLLGVFQINQIVSIVAGLGTVSGAAYVLWRYNRIIFGRAKIKYRQLFKDLILIEFRIRIPLAVLIIYFGRYPSPLLHMIHGSVSIRLPTYSI